MSRVITKRRRDSSRAFMFRNASWQAWVFTLLVILLLCFGEIKKFAKLRHGAMPGNISLLF